jgi:hypothetical protein
MPLTVVSPAAKSIGGKHPIEGFRMIGHGDTVFRTLLGLSQAAGVTVVAIEVSEHKCFPTGPLKRPANCGP